MQITTGSSWTTRVNLEDLDSLPECLYSCRGQHILQDLGILLPTNPISALRPWEWIRLSEGNNNGCLT